MYGVMIVGWAFVTSEGKQKSNSKARTSPHRRVRSTIVFLLRVAARSFMYKTKPRRADPSYGPYRVLVK